MVKSDFSIDNIVRINQRLINKKEETSEPKKLSGLFNISAYGPDFNQEKIHTTWQKVMVKYA